MSIPSQLYHLDRAVALSRIGGDEQLLQEIAKLFLDDYPLLLDEIRDALAARDAHKLERGAHTLKGSVANFGAQRAVEAAFRLECIGRSRNLAEAGQALAELEARLFELHPDLARICADPASAC